MPTSVTDNIITYSNQYNNYIYLLIKYLNQKMIYFEYYTIHS